VDWGGNLCVRYERERIARLIGVHYNNVCIARRVAVQPHVVCVAVGVVQTDDVDTEPFRHMQQLDHAQLREVGEALDTEKLGEAGGLLGRDAVRNHRGPEGHCCLALEGVVLNTLAREIG
jgi:hypothetical protein